MHGHLNVKFISNPCKLLCIKWIDIYFHTVSRTVLAMYDTALMDRWYMKHIKRLKTIFLQLYGMYRLLILYTLPAVHRTVLNAFKGHINK